LRTRCLHASTPMTKAQAPKYIATSTAMSTTNRPLLTPMICGRVGQVGSE
jgi:hypothetical protein